MSSIRKLVRADARLTILQALAEDPSYAVNHRILRSVVERRAAITMSDDEVRLHLAWLEDRGAVTTEEVPPLTVAKLTDLGLELARGRIEIEGIARPTPDQV